MPRYLYNLICNFQRFIGLLLPLVTQLVLTVLLQVTLTEVSYSVIIISILIIIIIVIIIIIIIIVIIIVISVILLPIMFGTGLRIVKSEMNLKWCFQTWLRDQASRVAQQKLLMEHQPGLQL